ncbi:hypothetical protein J4X79_21800, partial [Escherichia coli]
MITAAEACILSTCFPVRTVIRTDDERTHQYHYDSQHRLVHYTRTQYAEPLVESRYLYDPL